MRVLIIEDDVEVADNIGRYLERRGHVVDMANDGLFGLRLAERESFDAVVLDLTLPRLDGLEVCRRLRAAGVPPAILMLTARDTVEDKIEGFESGADDYLVKPFSLAELEIRLRVLTERSGRSERAIRAGSLSLNVDTLQVKLGDKDIATTPAGRRILEVLMRNAHRVVTRVELEQALWPDDEAPDSDSLRTHIHGLRRLLSPENPSTFIRTIRGEGYRLVVNDGE